MLEDYLVSGCLKGRSVFVTGGGSGVNLAIAKVLAKLGANIGICGRSEERLIAASTDLSAFGGKIFTQVADVRYPSGGPFNYPQVVATEIRFGAWMMAELNRV